MDAAKFYLGGMPIEKNIVDFFNWWSSNLMSNATRGILAEYIVAVALGCDHEQKSGEWDGYDLLTPDGIKVEVKSSSYLQAWKQSKPSKIVFSIAASKSFDSHTGLYSDSPGRPSDIYVFCLFNCQDRTEACPRNLDQWTFYLMATREINRLFGMQKSVSLSRLISSGAASAEYATLGQKFRAVASGLSR